jgi:hypothetical protein
MHLPVFCNAEEGRDAGYDTVRLPDRSSTKAAFGAPI